MAFTDDKDGLLKKNGGITHHGSKPDDDEEMTPSLENFIVLTWLRLIHEDLPCLVKQRYGTELRSRTLASINTGDPLHSRAACTQPCNVNTHSRAHCSPGARLCEQWEHGCVNNGARLCASARLCRGSPVIKPEISQALDSLLNEVRSASDQGSSNACWYTPKFHPTAPEYVLSWCESHPC